MLEIIGYTLSDAIKKISVTGVLSGAKQVIDYTKKRRLVKLGSQLFLVYLKVEDIVELGFEILPKLRFVVRKHRDQVFVNGYIAPTLEKTIEDIKELIPKQLLQISELCVLYEGVRRSVAAFDPDNAPQMINLVHGKFQLLSLLNSYDYIRFDVENFKIIVEQELRNFSDNNGKSRLLGRHGYYTFTRKMSDNMLTCIPYSKKVYSILEKYLEAELPERRLNLLHSLAKQYREILAAHFDFNEILLELELDRISRNLRS